MDADDPRLPFDDPTQRRYEIIRPVVVIGNRTATERAQEVGLHPETVGTLKRRFEKQGMLGLVPDTVEAVPVHRRRRIPAHVVYELQRLKGLYEGFGYRELARIIFHRVEYQMDPKTVKRFWETLPPISAQQLPLLDYHSYADPAQARLGYGQKKVPVFT